MSAGAWTINDATLDALNVRAASLRLANRGEDQLALTLATDPGWTFGQAITVKRNGSTFWTGSVAIPARRAARGGDGYDVAVRNGWYDLAQRPFENAIAHYNAGAETPAVESISVPEAMLGQDATGAHIKTGAVIAQAVAWAQGRGDAISSGTIMDGRFAPQTLAVDLSCLDVIRKMLVYHPDASAWIDGTALHVRAPADLETVTIDLEDDGPLSWSVVDRSDLVPVGFKLVWKKMVTEDGVGRVYYQTESKGTLTGKPAAPVVMIELAGANIVNERVEVKTRTLPNPADLSAARAKRFYQGLIPWLKDADAADIEIRDQSLSVVDAADDDWSYDDDAIPTDGETSVGLPSGVLSKTESELYSHYPRQLVQGSIADWMSVEAWPARLRATVFYKGTDAEIVRAMGGARRYSAAGAAYFSTYQVDELITITDALPRVYEKAQSYDAGGSPLSGLADDYWAAINRTRLEGSLSARLWGSAKFPTLKPGKKILITDEMAEAVPIEAAEFDLVADAGSWAFGVPDHLSLGDMYELSQIGNVNPSSWFTEDERTTGSRPASKTLSDASKVSGAATTQQRGTGASDAWGLDIYESGGSTKWRVIPGGIKSSADYDAAAELAITSLTAEQSVPTAGQVAYVEFTFDTSTGELTGQTFTVGAQWAEWPSPYKLTTVSSVLRLEKFRWLLYTFHAAANADLGGAGLVPITDAIYARRIALPVPFLKLVDVSIKDSATGQRARAVDLVPSAGFSYE